MTAKGELMRNINLLSSGTIAGFIGSDKYAVIDRAATKTLLYVSTRMTEQECAAVQTMEDLAALFARAKEEIP